MLDNIGFDLWADGYDQSVGLSDEDGAYPFAGYKQILNAIYNRVLAGKKKAVVDIGFGTGTLTAKLYEQGCNIWGQDFTLPPRRHFFVVLVKGAACLNSEHFRSSIKMTLLYISGFYSYPRIR